MNGMATALAPELLLLAAALLVTALESIWPSKGLRLKAAVGLAALAGAFFLLPGAASVAPDALAGMWAGDALATVFKVAVLVAAALSLLIAVEEIGARSRAGGEYVILLLLAAVGMMVMISGTDLVLIFLGIELMAVSFYVLAGFTWFRETSAEGALKYVITGLFASALLLYGLSLVYGATGSTSLGALAGVGRGGEADALVLAGLAFLACGLAFKMGAAPFQMWMPDVLEGAPTPVAGYLAVGPKIAVMGVAARVFAGGFPDWFQLWGPVWWSLAALTILWGNLAALAQESVKRMLAYSSVAHVGYLLVAVVATGRNPAATGPLAFYLLAYAFMNLGAFGTLLWFERATGAEVTWRDLAGFGRRRPAMGAFFALFLLSLAGIPPTAGFPAKFWIFLEGWQAGYGGLVLVALLGSAIGAYYYLRVVYALYLLPEPETTAEVERRGEFSWLAYAVVLAAVGTLVAGVVPSFFVELASRAILG
ncbi:MAG TPA: NADH-quinone oxidoreductase subunit N [bacterium]